jgi:hypothetical protein
MVDGHSRGHTTEGLLPRATINTPCALRLKEDMGGRMTLVSGYVFSYEPEQRGNAPAAAMLFAWTFTTFSLHSDKNFQGWCLFVCHDRVGLPALCTCNRSRPGLLA